VRWIGLAGVVGLLAGCGSAVAPRAPAPARPPLLRQVDGFPLFELTDRSPTPRVTINPRAVGWACTVFVSARSRIVGRNFDFHDQPALLLHHEPPDGYASVSMIDMEYLGFDRAHLDRLEEPGAAQALARAARIPFDGMNEKGLVVTMAAVPHARSPHRAQATSELGVMRLALDKAADVAQAVRIFRATAVDFSGGPAIHYLVADPSGASAVIEYVGGRVRVVRNARAMTNFVLSTSSADQRAHDRRYHLAISGLGNGDLSSSATLALLRKVRQPITRWSAAYDMRHRTLDLVMGQRYGRVYRFGVTGDA